jgi:4-aminobutyrate aminotransferase-like enzyme
LIFFYFKFNEKITLYFVTESIQGVGGAVQFPKNFLKKTAELVRAGGGLVVSDEVQTGIIFFKHYRISNYIIIKK